MMPEYIPYIVSGFFLLLSVVIPILLNRNSNRANVISTQGRTLSDAFNEIEDLRKELKQSLRLQKVQWTYILRLLEEYSDKGLTPPSPPVELESDPEIMRFMRVERKRKSDPAIK